MVPFIAITPLSMCLAGIAQPYGVGYGMESDVPEVAFSDVFHCPTMKRLCAGKLEKERFH
jgi:hypothetical protein